MCGSAEESQAGEEEPCPRGHPNVPVITVLAAADFPPECQCCCSSRDVAVPARLTAPGLAGLEKYPWVIQIISISFLLCLSLPSCANAV